MRTRRKKRKRGQGVNFDCEPNSKKQKTKKLVLVSPITRTKPVDVFKLTKISQGEFSLDEMNKHEKNCEILRDLSQMTERELMLEKEIKDIGDRMRIYKKALSLSELTKKKLDDLLGEFNDVLNIFWEFFDEQEKAEKRLNGYSIIDKERIDSLKDGFVKISDEFTKTSENILQKMGDRKSSYDRDEAALIQLRQFLLKKTPKCGICYEYLCHKDQFFYRWCDCELNFEENDKYN